MTTLVKGQGSLYLREEVTEGTYLAETLASQAVEPLQDGLEFNVSRNEIERKTLTDTIEAVESRLGLKTVSGSIPLELKAGATNGEAPRGAILYESLFGSQRQNTTTITTKTGNTVNTLKLEDADVAKLQVGDCILLKVAGNYQVRPIASKVTTVGNASVTMAIPFDAVVDNAVIEKVTTYSHSSDSKSFSATFYEGGEIKNKISGLKAISASIEGWKANETPSVNFAVEGLDLQKEIASPTLSPNFASDALVPVIQSAHAWLGQDELSYSEFSLSIENTKTDLLDASSDTGKMGSRKTAFAVTGSINPYMSSDNLDRWNKYNNGDTTSLFLVAYNPTSTAGQFNQIVAIWLPNIKITNMPSADADGVLLDSIDFKCFRKNGNDTMFLSFI